MARSHSAIGLSQLFQRKKVGRMETSGRSMSSGGASVGSVSSVQMELLVSSLRHVNRATTLKQLFFCIQKEVPIFMLCKSACVCIVDKRLHRFFSKVEKGPTQSFLCENEYVEIV